ncbi:MAG: peptidyl-prolyl cis-trans isomerase [Phycisphaerales bacterium]|nr:peptidyl-prolyl cis-trans isomerase [Phycisphaerales bacterium]
MRYTYLTTLAAALTLAAFGTSLASQPGGGHEEKKPSQPPSVVQPKKEEKKAEAPAPAKEQLFYVQLQTSMGDILLELNQTKAPVSVANFLKYVDKGHYNGTIFHRVINGFMVQGGGFTPSMEQKPTEEPIKNEYTNGLKNERYTVAMARTNAPDSATAQFFINVADNGFLDRANPQTGGAGYAVFGRVVAGQDVVDKVKAVKTGAKGPMTDVPLQPVTINSAKRVSDEEAAKIRSGGAAKPADAGKPAGAPASTGPHTPGTPAQPDKK